MLNDIDYLNRSARVLKFIHYCCGVITEPLVSTAPPLPLSMTAQATLGCIPVPQTANIAAGNVLRCEHLERASVPGSVLALLMYTLMCV